MFSPDPWLDFSFSEHCPEGKFSILMKFNLLFILWIMLLMYLKRSSPQPRLPRFSVIFFYRFVLHVGIWLTELMFFERCTRFTFYGLQISSFSSAICWKTVLSPLNCLWSFIKDQLSIFVLVRFWWLYSAPLTWLSAPPPIPHGPGYCSFVGRLEVW